MGFTLRYGLHALPYTLQRFSGIKLGGKKWPVDRKVDRLFLLGDTLKGLNRKPETACKRERAIIKRENNAKKNRSKPHHRLIVI